MNLQRMLRIVASVSNKARRSPPSEAQQVETTKKHWGDEAGTWCVGQGVHWLEHQAVQDRVNEKVSGNPRKNPYVFFMDFLQRRGVSFPVSRCLTLGCGAGDLERGLAKHGLCAEHDGYDVSDVAIDRATRLANDSLLSHVHYTALDINRVQLPRNRYDMVFGVMSVHHFERLEHIFAQVRRSLKPAGLFFLNEFIGPTQFQWTDRQISITNALLQFLPERYRRAGSGQLKSAVSRPTIAEMNAVDPSESIRSGEIVDVLSQNFSIVSRRDYGGTILHLLLEGIARNFDYGNSVDMRFLRALFDLEDLLLDSGEITSDFSVLIAEPRGGS